MLAEASSNGLFVLIELTSHKWTLRGSEAEGVQESLLRRNGGRQAGGPIPVAEYRIGQMRYLQRRLEGPGGRCYRVGWVCGCVMSVYGDVLSRLAGSSEEEAQEICRSHRRRKTPGGPKSVEQRGDCLQQLAMIIPEVNCECLLTLNRVSGRVSDDGRVRASRALGRSFWCVLVRRCTPCGRSGGACWRRHG